MTDAEFSVSEADWDAERASLRAVRYAVFVQEQHVPEDLEWDEFDARSRHVLARAADGSAIGTARLLPDASIGRMAVLKPWRGRGVGSAILKRVLALAAEQGYSDVHLHAQTHAVPFYARHGFVVSGEEFMEAGIPHRCMRKPLDLPRR
jgi:predicted GNAT family N-acyltransferase